MSLLLTPTPTHAWQRVPNPLPAFNTLDDLLTLQDEIECDMYITMPDEYGQRRVFLYDP